MRGHAKGSAVANSQAAAFCAELEMTAEWESEASSGGVLLVSYACCLPGHSSETERLCVAC